MLYVKYEDAELRSICKSKLESLEYYLRRIIHFQLSESYGKDYIDYTDKIGNRIINKTIKDDITKNFNNEKNRYSRLIDATLLDHLIDIICNPPLFDKHFKSVFESAFPEGRQEARTFFKRLIKPRNHLSHANPIALRDVERVVCYSNDIIESIKLYYLKIGMEQEFNVPTIIRITDSFGNVFNCDDYILLGFPHFSLSERKENYLRPGDILTIELEIDSCYLREEYLVYWKIGSEIGYLENNQTKLVLEIEEKHVGKMFYIECMVKSKLNWHKYSSYDSKVDLCYCVLPSF